MFLFSSHGTHFLSFFPFFLDPADFIQMHASGCSERYIVIPCSFGFQYMIIGQGFDFVCTGDYCVTRLFDREPDHLVPSSSTFLFERDLLVMMGIMVNGKGL